MPSASDAMTTLAWGFFAVTGVTNLAILIALAWGSVKLAKAQQRHAETVESFMACDCAHHQLARHCMGMGDTSAEYSERYKDFTAGDAR